MIVVGWSWFGVQIELYRLEMRESAEAVNREIAGLVVTMYVVERYD